jgi:pimeloyl-ACP methyl ester carboxylesterase
MAGATPLHLNDIRGLTRLAVDATTGTTDLVEAVHSGIAHPLHLPGGSAHGRTRGITGLVYNCIRGVTRLVGFGSDVLLARLTAKLGEQTSSRGREAVLAALNGVLGDHLAVSGNPLAIPMTLRRDGQRSGKLLVLAHGLCMNDLQWHRREHDHGAALARELGYTPLYLRYNSGLHVSTNGRAFAALLTALVAEWPQPVEEIVILAHSMGGLLARSACHLAARDGHAWLRHLRKIVFLGTPHHGAPLERGGNWVNILLEAAPYAAPFARLGKIRSAGITDLRYGNLLDEDWAERDRFHHAPDNRCAVPLPAGVDCFTAAATTGKRSGDLNDRLLADGLVPVNSALGRHQDAEKSLPIPESRQWIGYGMNHMDLLSRPEVYEQIRHWIA